MPVIERSRPGSWRQDLKQRVQTRRPGQDAGLALSLDGPVRPQFGSDARWLPGYRPLTEEARATYEAWQAQERLRQSREAVERCIRLYEREVEKGDPDFGMYDLRGRVYHALNGNEWREWWSVRDRAYAAQRDAERLMRRGKPEEAAPRWQGGVIHNRRALELTDDPAYRKALTVDPSYAEACQNLLLVLEQTGRLAEAGRLRTARGCRLRTD